MADDKPASVPSWATDASFSSGPKSGSVTKVQPSSGALAQGDVPGQPYRAERHNWLWNLICAWLFYLSDLHNQVQFLNKDYHFTGSTFEMDGDVTVGGNTVLKGNVTLMDATHTSDIKYDYERTRVKLIPVGCFTLQAQLTGDKYFVDSSGVAIGNPNYLFRYPLSLPSGAQLNQVRVGFKQGRAASSTACHFLVERHTPVITGTGGASTTTQTPSYSPSSWSSTDHDYGIASSGPIIADVDNSTSTLEVLIGPSDQASDDAGIPGHYDYILFIEVTYVEVNATGTA